MKNYYTEVFTSDVITDMQKRVVYHLVFPNKDKDSVEKAFVAFCSNILYLETYLNKRSAFSEIKAMTGLSTSHICWGVNFKSIKPDRAKDIVKYIVKSLPNGLHANNIPAFCYILFNIIGEQKHVWRKVDMIDEKEARKWVDEFPLLKMEECYSNHMNDISFTLEQIYIIGLGKRACVIDFMEKTWTFLNEDYFNDLVQKAVGNAALSMPLFVNAENMKIDAILLKILKESKYPLLEKILRHFPHACSFEEYISVMRVLLQNAEEVGIFEKLTDSCRQKCSQWVVQDSRTGNLKSLLGSWTTIQNLHPDTYGTLVPAVEKGILECIGNDAKLVNFDKRADFMHSVVEGPIFSSYEEKFELLKRLAETKKNLRSCVPDLLAEGKFQSMPDDYYSKIVILWLQNSIQLDRRRGSPEERIVKAYEYLSLLGRMPPVKRIEDLHNQIDNLVFKTIEQYNTRELMRAVTDIEDNIEQQNLFRNHMRKILHGKNSKKSPRDIIQDICGTDHLRIRTRFVLV